MDPNIITCPHCQNTFSVSDVMNAELEEKFTKKIQEKLHKQMVEWQEKEKEKAALKMKDLLEENERKSKELIEARVLEIKIRREKNDLEEAKAKFELEKQRQLDEERGKIRADAIEKFSEEKQFEILQMKKQLEDTQKALEEAKRKSDQISQQLQGEVQELKLEEILKVNFPLDSIESVGKGVNGADCLQKVNDNTGRLCGVIVWESKRTKNWTEGWVQKLVDDQRAIKGDVAILVSSVLPDGVKKFGPYEKIYVTGFENCLEVAKMVRLKIIELCYAKSATDGKNDKKEILWTYLTGNEFKSRVEAMVEVFSVMRDDLEKEKIYFTKKWAKEEKMIGRMTENLIGMHGDIQGLIGTSLPEIESTQMLTLDLIDMSDEVIS